MVKGASASAFGFEASPENQSENINDVVEAMVEQNEAAHEKLNEMRHDVLKRGFDILVREYNWTPDQIREKREIIGDQYGSLQEAMDDWYAERDDPRYVAAMTASFGPEVMAA
jgi:hypothetical protein